LDVTTVRAALVATILVEVAVTAILLASFVAPPGINPHIALRLANTFSASLKETICYKVMSCFMNGHQHMMFKLKIQL
jgi:hypothetical protein